MDDKRADRESGSRWALTLGNRRPHVLPFCVALLVYAIFLCGWRPDFWSYRFLVGMCLVIAILVWDKLRVKPKDF
jgi:Flp pilus assembly protein TadB